MGRERERRHPDPIIKGLRRVETGLRQSGERTVRHHWIAGADAMMGDGFSRARTDIDVNFINRSRLRTALMGREGGDDADEFFLRRTGEDAETLRGEHAIRPAADRHETQETIGGDRLHQKADLIHMRGEDHARAFHGLGRRGEHPAESIGL